MLAPSPHTTGSDKENQNSSFDTHFRHCRLVAEPKKAFLRQMPTTRLHSIKRLHPNCRPPDPTARRANSAQNAAFYVAATTEEGSPASPSSASAASSALSRIRFLSPTSNGTSQNQSRNHLAVSESNRTSLNPPRRPTPAKSLHQDNRLESNMINAEFGRREAGGAEETMRRYSEPRSATENSSRRVSSTESYKTVKTDITNSIAQSTATTGHMELEGIDIDEDDLSDIETDDEEFKGRTGGCGGGWKVDPELAAETIERLRAREAKWRAPYVPDAPLAKFRSVVVEWMREVASEQGLVRGTLHLAVAIFDIFISSANLSMKRNLQLVALGCILISAKYAEPQLRIPSLNELSECCEWAHTPAQLVAIEKQILRGLGWYLGLPTTSAFLDFYFEKGIFDIKTEKPSPDRGQSEKWWSEYIKRCKDFFTELCLSDYSMRRYPPSVRAAAIVGCCRQMLMLRGWPSWLEERTHCSSSVCGQAAEYLWNAYLIAFKEHKMGLRS